MLERVWRKGNPLTLLVGMQTGTATMENSVEIPEKLEIELPYNPAIPLLGIYQEKQTKKQNTPENTNSKRCMHPSVHRSIINSC